MRVAFIVYAEIPDEGVWIGNELMKTKKKLERALRDREPETYTEVSFLPTELHPLVQED